MGFDVYYVQRNSLKNSYDTTHPTLDMVQSLQPSLTISKSQTILNLEPSLALSSALHAFCPQEPIESPFFSLQVRR